MRSRARAILWTLAATATWLIGVPAVLVAMGGFLDWHDLHEPPSSFLFLLSPATAVALTELGEFYLFEELGPFGPMLANYAYYAALLYGFWSLSMATADGLLGRADEPLEGDWRPPAVAAGPPVATES